jgi:hypothetical protein
MELAGPSQQGVGPEYARKGPQGPFPLASET